MLELHFKVHNRCVSIAYSCIMHTLFTAGTDNGHSECLGQDFCLVSSYTFFSYLVGFGCWMFLSGLFLYCFFFGCIAVWVYVVCFMFFFFDFDCLPPFSFFSIKPQLIGYCFFFF